LVDVVTRQVETLSANIANNREDMSAIKRAVESLERDMQDFERVLLRGNGRDAIVAQLASMQNRLGTLEQRITGLHESVRRIRKSDADLRSRLARRSRPLCFRLCCR
jgi:chromosome segregation ATPase